MMMGHLSVVGVFSFLIASVSFAAPAQVVILRHGEKPATGNTLDTQGYQRAAALPSLFKTDPDLTRYGTPAAIYAMEPASEDGSVRAIETVTPLAQALGLTIQESFTKNQLARLVNAVMTHPSYEGKTVVICWEHDVIPTMVDDFGYKNAPQTWPDDVFDRLWFLHFTGNEVTSFENLPQHLLPGDSAE
jgi:hypothetical protein